MANPNFKLTCRQNDFFETHNGKFFSAASLAQMKQLFLDKTEVFKIEKDATVLRHGEEMTAVFWVAEFCFTAPFTREPIVAIGLSRNNHVLALTIQENNRLPYWSGFPTQDAVFGECILDIMKQHVFNVEQHNKKSNV